MQSAVKELDFIEAARLRDELLALKKYGRSISTLKYLLSEKMDLNKLLKISVEASLIAGEEIMKIYETADFGVVTKDDESPLTLADQISNDIISKALILTPIPVLSEEGREIPYSERKNWKHLWIVDPLDGTKEFIKKNDEFTVNIALIENGRPILGVIYVPVFNTLYWGHKKNWSI